MIFEQIFYLEINIFPLFDRTFCENSLFDYLVERFLQSDSMFARRKTKITSWLTEFKLQKKQSFVFSSRSTEDDRFSLSQNDVRTNRFRRWSTVDLRREKSSFSTVKIGHEKFSLNRNSVLMFRRFLRRSGGNVSNKVRLCWSNSIKPSFDEVNFVSSGKPIGAPRIVFPFSVSWLSSLFF